MKDYIQESREQFNRQADKYDDTPNMYYFGPAKISCVDGQAHLLALSFDSLLDVDCGTGFLLDRPSQIRVADYHGLNLSENMLRAAESKGIPNTAFVQGPADTLPYEGNRFDVVTCIQNFHHHPDPDKAMRKALRVLKPGGLCLLSDAGVGGIGA